MKLNAARIPLKELRDNEVTLFQRRNFRTGIENQITRIENNPEKGYEKRVAELKEQLAKAESDDEPLEKQHEVLLRRALRESELQKFQALREVNKIPPAQLITVLILLSTGKKFPSSRRPQSLSSL